MSTAEPEPTSESNTINLQSLADAPIEQSILASVREASRKLKVNVKPWKSNIRVAKGQWITDGLPRPTNKRGLPKMERPLGSLTVYQVNDPYTPEERATFRLLMEENMWILRANVIIQKLVVTASSTDAVPRKDMEIEEEALDKWREAPIYVPFFARLDSAANEEQENSIPEEEIGMRTPNQIKEWIDRKSLQLDTQSVWFNAYLTMREQGRCVVGMFPEERDENNYWQIPQAIRSIPSEFTRRPVLNFDTGELEAVEVTGLQTGNGNLDANRAVYLMNANNLQLFSDFYGRSQIRALMDIGKVLLTIYGSDFPHAAEFTWHQPKVFRHTFPARDIAKGEAHLQGLMDKFNQRLQNNAGKDVSVTQATEEVSNTTNSGDITGLIEIQNETIDAIAAFYNIPPFLLAKGKPGRLGGNANREEIDSFLNVEIRPEQEILENIIEKQYYDRLLAILFDVEPDMVSDHNAVPIKIEHNFEKPDLAAAIDIEQYEILKDMRTEGLITTEKMMEKLGIRELLDDNITGGEDTTPAIKTWIKKNPHWKPGRSKNSQLRDWQPKSKFIRPVAISQNTGANAGWTASNTGNNDSNW